ncbi:unnamed protein product [Ceutorhynchus assimilis]|uniref:Protein Wnt n=1 Tax=Ceutorhynchus assimilis TaxID=467358 RepID=A0A9N9MQ92_9CUCU|nr:unnamed protein product [Ceutorhynchus assimilis]
MNRIIPVNNRILTFLIVLCFVTLIFGSATFNSSLKRNIKMVPRKRSVIELLFTSNASFFDPDLETGKNLCRWLKGLKFQRKICQRRRGLPLILQQTRLLALKSCENQFQYEQWNCSSTHMKKIFKRSYRETAFMYSLASSALGYILAQACVDGKLANCKCTSQLQSDNPIEEWGGCSVNTKIASRFVEKFLLLKDKGDNPSDIMKYNSRVGLRIMQNKTEKYCKCHGVSGACTHKICWMRVKPFRTVAEKLKQLYHNAIKVEPDNSIHNIRVRKKMKQLVYLDPTPNFCDSRKNFGLSTTGRQCKDVDNCATLCCSNDYKISTRKVLEKCNCSWKNDTHTKYQVELKCDDCAREEILYHCK